jgi:hypothetical protein
LYFDLGALGRHLVEAGRVTSDVYAQLQQRVDREHGRAFDALVRQARERLYGAAGTQNRLQWVMVWVNGAEICPF